MKRILLTLFVLFSILSLTFSQETSNDETDDVEEIEINCDIIQDRNLNTGTHRTPPLIPVVYLNRTQSSIVFDAPCYDTLIYIIDLRDGAEVFNISVPSGAHSVALPSFLSGDYELHIHRGSFCFHGTISIY